MNFISLDLELNNAEDNSIINPKIIQVGISIGNDTQIILTKSWFLNPGEPIYPFITKLTGIQDSDVINNSTSLENLALELSELIKNYNCFVNPVTWGVGDVVALMNLFKEKNIKFPHFGRRELDVKQIYTFLMMSKGLNCKGGLSSAMGKFKTQFRGNAHRADVDAENTLRFFFELLKRQKKFEEILTTSKCVQY